MKKRTKEDLAQEMADYLVQDDREYNDWLEQQQINDEPTTIHKAIANGLDASRTGHIFEIARAWIELKTKEGDEI